MTDLLETEVLILGCGIAGSTAALTLADAGVPVCGHAGQSARGD